MIFLVIWLCGEIECNMDIFVCNVLFLVGEIKLLLFDIGEVEDLIVVFEMLDVGILL